MKKINLIVSFIAIVFLNINGNGQTNKNSYLHRGEKVPDFSMQVAVGNKSENLPLHQIKKKLILLDIWGVNCSSCIKEMPHLLALQQQLKDDVQIILVSKAKKEQVDGLWSKLKGHIPQTIIDAYHQLPSIVGDTVITRTFFLYGNPTHLWIDSNYTLRAISGGTKTTLENMQAFITNREVHLDEQATKKMDVTNPLSWLDKDTGFLDHLQSYSLIFSSIDHLGIGDWSVNPKTDSASGNIIGFSCVNLPLIYLYKLAYFKYHPYVETPDYRIFLNMRNKGKFTFENRVSRFKDWRDTSFFCFAIKVRPSEADRIYPLMQDVLNNHFHYQCKIETRRIKCLALKRLSGEEKFKTTSKNQVYEFSVDAKGSFLIMKNQPMVTLFSNLNSLVSFRDHYRPFFDETGYTGNIDMTLPWTISLDGVDYDQVKKTLNSYGLDLVEEYKDLEVLVISDAD